MANTSLFVFGVIVGIALDQANTRGWLKLAFDKAVAALKARGTK